MQSHCRAAEEKDSHGRFVPGTAEPSCSCSAGEENFASNFNLEDFNSFYSIIVIVFPLK